MKAHDYISKRSATVVLGLIVCLLILSTTNYQLTTTERVADQTAESSDVPQLSIKSFDILNSSAQIQLDHQFILVREIEEESDEEIANEFKHQIQSHCIRAFQILFRLIISPNAP